MWPQLLFHLGVEIILYLTVHQISIFRFIGYYFQGSILLNGLFSFLRSLNSFRHQNEEINRNIVTYHVFMSWLSYSNNLEIILYKHIWSDSELYFYIWIEFKICYFYCEQYVVFHVFLLAVKFTRNEVYSSSVISFQRATTESTCSSFESQR